MFKRILIANRGEIACRIIQTAKKMGIETVSVYSEADAQSLHVQQADFACCIGSPPAKDSYLNISTLIETALTMDVEAIHPGYGFLSENLEFAKACLDAGIVFIGPSVAAIQAMASKQLAKQLLSSQGIPLIPGYHGNNQEDDYLLAEAEKIGFPVLLKAACGGGGKGMRAVENAANFLEALQAARREAKASFADDTMIIEKLIQEPRHVEVQIIADQQGHILHLFDRDCSIQRRHQKIIEEAPAPNLDPNLRLAMLDAACKAAQTIQYTSAGTVEFLVDHGSQFYFMEMNTRLQVEHPVTEMITGLDLVALQIQIAAGNPLPFSQKEIVAQGHAIECRIYAEDPEQQFLPSTGMLDYWKPPLGEGLRLDSGVAEQSIITRYYDPMMAKLISWGNCREEALMRLRQALKQFFIGGIKTNLSFLYAICSHPRFIQSQLSTHFLTEAKLTLANQDPVIAVLLAASYDYGMLSKQNNALQQATFAWQLCGIRQWDKQYKIAQKEYTVRFLAKSVSTLTLIVAEKIWEIGVDSSKYHITVLIHAAETPKQVQRYSIPLMPDERGLTLFFPFTPLYVQAVAGQNSAPTADTNNQLTAPMPANVVAIFKKPGEAVKKGEPLMVLEAMKMEHTLHAPHDGIIQQFFYTIGASVPEGVALLQLVTEPKD